MAGVAIEHVVTLMLLQWDHITVFAKMSSALCLSTIKPHSRLKFIYCFFFFCHKLSSDLISYAVTDHHPCCENNNYSTNVSNQHFVFEIMFNHVIIMTQFASPALSLNELYCNLLSHHQGGFAKEERRAGLEEQDQ